LRIYHDVSYIRFVLIIFPSSSQKNMLSIGSLICLECIVIQKSRSLRFLVFADLAGVEGPKVPLMLGDVPSLLEHLESNLKGNQPSKLSLTVRLRVTACYRKCFVRVPFFPDPSSSHSLAVVVDPSFRLAFSLSFSCRFLFIFHVWLQLMRQLEWCLFPRNFSEMVATYRRVCQAGNLDPHARKISFFPYSSLFMA
jgi:hypothetical protein